MKKLILYILLFLALALSFAAGYFFYERTRGFTWVESEGKSVGLVRELLSELKNSRDFTSLDSRKFFGRNLDSPRIYESDAEYMSVLRRVLGGLLKSENSEFTLSCGVSEASNSADSSFSRRAYDERVVCVIENLSVTGGANLGGIARQVDIILFSVEPYDGILRTNIYLNGKLIWEDSKD